MSVGERWHEGIFSLRYDTCTSHAPRGVRRICYGACFARAAGCASRVLQVVRRVCCGLYFARAAGCASHVMRDDVASAAGRTSRSVGHAEHVGAAVRG